MVYLWYIAVGAITGLFSGMLGIGGGLIIVPSLMIILSYYRIIGHEQLMHVCVATSLACAIVNLVIAVFQHNKRHTVRWPVFYAILPGVLLGSFVCGPALMLYVSGHFLKLLFGCFCLTIGIYLLFCKKSLGQESLPNKWRLSVFGLFIATLSTLLGIAGGIIIGALFSIWRMSPREVVGTISAIGLPIAVGGTIGIIAISLKQPNLPRLSTGYLYWPAFIGIMVPSLLTVPLGAMLSHKLPVTLLKKAFACLVLIVGLNMLI